MFYGTPETVIRQSPFRDQTMDMWIPLQRTAEGMQDRDETRGIAFGFVLFMEHVEHNTADCLKETVEKRSVFEKEGPQIFIDGKNAVSMGTGDEFKSHAVGAFLGILDPAGRTETAFASERNELHVVAMRAHVHSAPKRRVATMDHSVYVSNNRRTWMELINHFFIMVCKNLL